MAVGSDVLRNIPDEPGVYLFSDGEGAIIYVGKAISLRNRVRNHFQQSNTEPKEVLIREATETIEFFITGNEAEAFILENNLIKKHTPIYNIRLKDDKSFPSLKVTLHEECPGIYVTRELVDDGSVYYGPYANAGGVKRVIRYVKKLFGIRYCRKPVSFGSSRKPCLNYQIHLCSAPCAGMIGAHDYGRSVEQVRMFLEGDIDNLLLQLEKEMTELSENRDYERAAVIRDRINDIKIFSERQRVSKALAGDMDVVGVAIRGNRACIQQFMVRRGNLIGKLEHYLDVPFGSSSPEVLTAFVEQYYFGKMNHPQMNRWVSSSETQESASPSLPPPNGGGIRRGFLRIDMPLRILVSHRLTSRKFIDGWLRKKGIRSKITSGRGELDRDLKELVLKNAREKLSMELELGREIPALAELHELLELESLPERIEGVDISNIGGKYSVGSLVTFLHGKPDKKNYRKFRIRTVEGIDDYAMVREVVRRRYSRAVKEGNELPDLILIDGGKGHLGSAVAELDDMGLDIPVISIAKKREEVFSEDSDGPLPLSRKSEALGLIRAVRDEAHRFAISYHKNIRRKKVRGSVLEKIPGIGKAKRIKLMKRFGSIKNIRERTVEELAETPLVNEELARRVLEYLRGR